MSDQLSRTNDTSLHMEPPKTEDQAAEALTGKALTLEYRPARANALAISESDSGRFGAFSWRVLHDIESMICHPDVAQPYSYYKAGISSVKFEVTAQTMEQAKFAHDLLTRVWERHLDQLQYAYDYGWCGYELTYTDDDHGRMDLDQILDLHPLDVWAVTRKGQYRGLRLKPSGLSSLPSGGILRLQGSTDLWGPGKWPAKALWLTHERRFDRFYGRTQLLGAWRPWMRLAGRDGAEDVLDGCLYRVGYQGPEIRYPPEDFKKTGGGVDYDAARNEARQMAEQAKSGFSVALPSTYHQGGQPKWEVKFPTSAMSGIGTFLDWESNLQKQISRGVGVPPELLEASDTGSGYSGRKIPLLGFYESQLKNARNIVRALVDQVVLPLLKWNWGDDAWAEVKVDLEPPAAITGDKEQAQGGMPPQGAMPPEMPGAESMPPSPDGQQGMGGLEDLLPDEESSGGPGLAQLLGGELSTIAEAPDDPNWLDPGFYPADDRDYWSVSVGGYELASADGGSYEQRQITSGPRAGQSGWYNTQSQKFMPADWSPGQQGQQKGQPQQGREVRQPSAPLPVTIQRQPLPSQSQAQPQQQATSQYPQRGGEVRAPSAPLSVTKQRPPLPSQDPSQPEQPKQPKQPKPRETAIIPKEKADDFRRVVDAASKDLSNKEHPLHVSRMRSQLAHADFGAGPVKTLRPTKDAPLSKSDHEAMDRAHSRAAAVLNMAGRNKEANAQLAAAKYHRGLSERRNVTAQKPAAAEKQPLPSWLHTPKQQIPAPPPGWKKEHMGMSSDRAGRAAREEALKGGADANTAMRIGRAVSQHVYDYSLHAPNVEKRVLASDRNAQADHQAVLKELRKRLPEMQSMHRKYMQEGYGASGRELSTALQPPVFTLSAAQPPNDPEDVLDAVAGRARTLTRQARAALLAAVEAAPYGQALTAARRWADEWSGELAELLGETRLAAILHGMDGIASQLDAGTLPLTGQPELAEDSTLPLVKEAANRLAGMQLLGMPGYLSAKEAAQNAATVEAEQMTAEAIGKVRSALARSIEEGGTLAEFKADLKDAFSEGVLTPDHVTEQVFRTNVMAAYSDGQERLLADPLVGDLFPYRAYYATHDDRTREEHLGMEKRGIGGTNIYRADDPVWQMFRPPWGHQCFLPGTVVQGKVQLASKSWYSGEAVELVTRSGQRLAVTGNHPILTSRGFIPAKDVRKGENLLRYQFWGEDGEKSNGGLELIFGISGAGESGISSPLENKQYAPARIEDVFNSFSAVGWNIRLPVRPDDLHGDAAFGNGYVDVVSTHRELLLNLQPNMTDGDGHVVLSRGNESLPLVSGVGSGNHAFLAVNPTLGGSPGATTLADDCASVAFDERPLGFFRLGLAANLDASRYESTSEQRSRDEGFFSELVDRFPSDVAGDEVVDIKKFPYAGHVYDLQTSDGWIVANSIFASNCRCTFTPVSVAEAARRGIAEAQQWLSTGVEPATKAHVPMPPWKPDDEFLNRGVELNTDWDENKHKRAGDGKFSSTGGGGDSSSAPATREEQKAARKQLGRDFVGKVRDIFGRDAVEIDGSEITARDANRWLSFEVDLRKRFVHIDFGQRGAPPTVSEKQGNSGAYSTAKELQSGTIDLLHKMKSVIQEMHKLGLAVEYETTDPRRQRLYPKMLAASGFEEVRPGFWQPAEKAKGDAVELSSADWDEAIYSFIDLPADPDYPVADLDDWSEPTGYELAAPDSSRYQQRKVTRGPRRGQTAWYDSQRNRIMPANWKPSGEKAAKLTPKAGKTTATVKTPKVPAASVDELHEAITAAAKSGKPVNADDVKALAERVKAMKGADIQALRTKLGLSRTGGGSTKEAKAIDLAKKMLAGDPSKVTKGPANKPEGKPSPPDAPQPQPPKKPPTKKPAAGKPTPAPKAPKEKPAAKPSAMPDAKAIQQRTADKVQEVLAWEASPEAKAMAKKVGYPKMRMRAAEMFDDIEKQTRQELDDFFATATKAKMSEFYKSLGYSRSTAGMSVGELKAAIENGTIGIIGTHKRQRV